MLVAALDMAIREQCGCPASIGNLSIPYHVVQRPPTIDGVPSSHETVSNVTR